MPKERELKNGGKGTNVGNALRSLVSGGKAIAPEILSLAGTLTGVESLNKLGDLIRGSDMEGKDKDYLLEKLEADKLEMQEITKRWESDNNTGNWAAQNVRPYSLAFLLFSLFIFIVLDSTFIGFEIKDAWISLLSSLLLTAFGGYFGFRTVEKSIKLIKKVRE